MGLLPSKTVVIIFLCSISAIVAAQELETVGPIRYAGFNNFDLDSSNGAFHTQGNATFSKDAIQLTPDTLNPEFIKSNAYGRAFLKKRFKLWDSVNKTRVASFNTSFLVNIYPLNFSSGEGLAFLIAPGFDLLPESSHGQYLGLTNSTTDGDPRNQIVAIELDTFKQDFDPDNNHIGLDINGINSTIFRPLAPLNITLAPINNSLPEQKPSFHNVWVEYDGVAKYIRVYIIQQQNQTGPTPLRPVTPVIETDLDLSEVVNQYSYFGFSGSTGETYELNCVLRWNLTVVHFKDEEGGGGGGSTAIAIGLGVGISALVLILLGAGFWYFFRRKKMVRTSSSILETIRSGLPGNPKEFDFRDLKKATNNFDIKRKLGEGGFGAVYRGSFEDGSLEIAVKWFLRESIKGQDDFLAELAIISRLRHKHLVRLIGWCHKNEKLLLVYEYMPKGSLDLHLFAGEEKPALNWNQRYKIISGVASALHYLHNEYDERVIHRDLKASNIMLDDNFNARLGDFGLARVLENEKTSYAEAEGVPGTFGYIAPECFHTGRATQQSDVYAFGAVLMEVVCGLRPGAKTNNFNTLVDWVWFLHRDGLLLEAVDARLGDDYVTEEAERLLRLGLACSHPIAGERPNTQAIVQIISGSVPAPHVPPFKPPFVWPAMMPLGMELNSSNTTSMTNTSQFNSGWSQSEPYLSRESYGESADQSMV